MNQAIINLGVTALYQDFTSRLLRSNWEFSTEYRLTNSHGYSEVSITVRFPNAAIGKPSFAVLYLYTCGRHDDLTLAMHIKNAEGEDPRAVWESYENPEEAWDALMQAFSGGAE